MPNSSQLSPVRDSPELQALQIDEGITVVFEHETGAADVSPLKSGSTQLTEEEGSPTVHPVDSCSPTMPIKTMDRSPRLIGQKMFGGFDRPSTS